MFLTIMPKWIKWMSFPKVWYQSSLPLFLRMLDNSHSPNVFESKCSSTWDCSWLLTVFLWNLKMVCKPPYKYKNIDLKFLSARIWALRWEMFVHSLWLHVPGRSKQKVKIIVFHCHLFFYRLWHVRSSIHPFFDIIYGFCPDATTENRLWYTHIQTIF